LAYHLAYFTKKPPFPVASYLRGAVTVNFIG